jgi:hypothetical protein
LEKKMNVYQVLEGDGGFFSAYTLEFDDDYTLADYYADEAQEQGLEEFRAIDCAENDYSIKDIAQRLEMLWSGVPAQNIISGRTDHDPQPQS